MTVRRDGDARVVLAGTLTHADVGTIGEVLVVLLRDVDCVVVDITALTLTDTSALRVFPDAVDRAGGWPVVRLAVVYAGRGMGQALRASRIAREVAVADEPELALLRCAQRPEEVRAQWWFPAAARSLAQCRGVAGMRLASWSLSGAEVERFVVVLNELVTNAVMHAGGAVGVQVGLDEEGAWLAVRDFSPGPPPDGAESRLGLRLVDALASRWGFETHEDGKTAWARLPR
jgi:hypothetical protein